LQQTFPNAGSGEIVIGLAEQIIANRAYLSEIDGKIGDGDHGVNMAKGFGIAAERIRGKPLSLSEGFAVLGDVLMGEIGGSMGPLYGMMFTQFSEAIEQLKNIDAESFAAMLDRGREAVETIGAARVGDKTLLDALVPAIDAFRTVQAEGRSFNQALDAMAAAAQNGRDSTRDLIARVGRASRLGERSRGVLDAGATSCAIIMTALAAGVGERLRTSGAR